MLRGGESTIHELVDYICELESVDDVIIVMEMPEFVDSSLPFNSFFIILFIGIVGFFKLLHGSFR